MSRIERILALRFGREQNSKNSFEDKTFDFLAKCM